MTLARYALLGLLRAPGRGLVRIVTLATAVALLGAMLVFVSHSLRATTSNAVAAVSIAWQGPVGSYTAAQQVAAGTTRQTGVAVAMATATAPFASATNASANGTIHTGQGAVLAVPADYLTGFSTIRILQGSIIPGGVVLDQQLAATLQAGIGDTVSLAPTATATPRQYKVTGVAVVSSTNTLFAPLDPRAGPAPAQPPAQIAIMPIEGFAQTYASALPSLTAASIGTGAIPGAQDGVQWQVQARIDTSALNGDPSSALQQATSLRNRVERSLPGQVQFVDNLAATLTLAAGDALYAEALYILLAIPGALVALGLVYLAALGTAEEDRRALALLRARGARRRDLVTLAVVESVALGTIAGAGGGVTALTLVPRIVDGPVGLGPAGAAATILACVVLACAGALAARLGASLGVRRGQVRDQRVGSSGEPGRAPLWQRLWVDLVAIATSLLVYWFTLRTGFAAVVSPDANPTLSLSVYMLFAPALLWIGVTLLLVRLRGRAITWLARRGASTTGGTLGGFLLASVTRRGAAINRGLVLVGLLLAFGVELGVFASTYQQQARVDAQLTIGADVVVSTPAGSAARLAPRVSAVPGVSATTLVNHTYAYIGPDLQDTYGIDAATISRATRLRDSYFIGGGAVDLMHRLASVPDGILVSKETVTDYALAIGDLVNLRVLDAASGAFVVAPFHVVGIVQEFPSAPKDSFMVANDTYLTHVTHGAGANGVFIRVDGNATLAGRQIAIAAGGGVSVRTIDEQTRQTVSSITTVDLAGISRIEEVFAVILAAIALTLLISVALAERRQELATMAAIGAPIRDIAAFLWSEAAIIVGGALALALALGLLLAEMLTAMLTHVFDPPPDALAIPWPYLGLLAGSAIAAAVLSTLVAVRRLQRLSLGTVLREQ